MFSFGILTGILFLLIVLAAFFYCMKRCFGKAKEDWIFIVGVFAITSFVGFGTLEADWRLGQLSFTAVFVVQYLLLHKCGKESGKDGQWNQNQESGARKLVRKNRQP